MIFDLDHFQLVNDRSGFVTGDVFLKIVAGCICNMKEDRIIFRFEGDSFIACFKGVQTTAEATELVKYFQQQIENHVEKNKELEDLSVSIGIALGESGKDVYSHMLRNADKALYMAKQYGGGRYCFYHRSEKKNLEINLSKADLRRLVLHIEELEQEQDQNQESNLLYNIYSEFDEIYKSVKGKTDHKHMQLALFTIQPNNNVRMNTENNSKVMEYLEKAVFKQTNESDIAIRYSSNQWIVILQDQDEDSANQIAEQIMKEFYKMYAKRNVSIHYAVAEVQPTASLHPV